eukprot:Phypoly_transcript_10248.p1 GENE.Phypoly_transcript_10248~~Phypoly_transcript_10248.p1  ORF type:complete len:356 (+),score=58.61 Phypoly_transcript_10248:56-1123(+)
MSHGSNANDLSFVSPDLRSHAVVEKAFQGSATDQYNLGTNFLEGANGFRKNNERGVYWLTQAVNGGEVFALNQLGLCYLEGSGVIKDEKLAFQLIKLGAEKGDVTAMVNAALLSTSGCVTNVDHRLAADFLKDAASKGYGPAAYQLGQLHMHGWGVAQDGSAAFQFFSSAADEGVLEAHSGLAQCYTDGIGTAPDLERAKQHWLTASYGGDPVALRCVGEKLLDGTDGFMIDREEARRYLERAAIAGDAQAQYKLALCCIKGIGGPVDLSAHDMWLEKAVAQRHPAAIAEKQPALTPNKFDSENQFNGMNGSSNFAVDSASDLNTSGTKGKEQKLWHILMQDHISNQSRACGTRL